MLVVTHDLGLAWNIADRIAVMYLGRIVEQGTTEELLGDPRHPYTRALLSVVPETRADGAADPQRRGARPDAHPGRLPLPPALPVVASGEAERLGIEDRCRARTSGSRRCGRGDASAPGGVPRRPGPPSPTRPRREHAADLHERRRSPETDAAFEAALADVRRDPGAPLPHVVGGIASYDGAEFARERPQPVRGGREPGARGAGRELVAEAIRVARAAQGGWRRLAVAERTGLLRAAGAAISERHMELAAAVSLEAGKSRTESIAEVQEAVDLIEAYCAQIEAHDGYSVPLGQLTPRRRTRACCGRSASSASSARSTSRSRS